MKRKGNLIVGLAGAALMAVGGLVLWQGSGTGVARGSNNTLVQTARAATAQFKGVGAAKQAGYAELYGCVSGPDQGAMGIHFVNGNLVDDAVDATKPEALLYDFQAGQLRLTGVEYVVIAADWDAAHPNAGPPVLDGQVFAYTASPNRYRIPAVYTLHVWAWKLNREGTFADWNPNVSCNDFTG